MFEQSNCPIWQVLESGQECQSILIGRILESALGSRYADKIWILMNSTCNLEALESGRECQLILIGRISKVLLDLHMGIKSES